MTWHLEKSVTYDQDATWLVFVAGQLVGTIAPGRLTWTRRQGYQGFVDGARTGRTYRTRGEAVRRVLEVHRKRSQTPREE